MAADLKAVGSTAADQEEHSTRVAKEDRLTATESHSEKESHLVTDHVEVSVRVARGHAEASVTTISAVKESRSATGRADHFQRAAIESRSMVREEVSVRAEKEDRSATDRSQTGHAGHSLRAEREDSSERGLKKGPLATARKEDLSESVQREDHSATGSRQDQDSILAARASTRRISTTSATRSRAESAE